MASLIRKLLDIDAREILKGGSASLLMKIVGTGLMFVFHALVARLLGADEAGAFFFALILINFSVVVCKLGSDLVAVKHIAILHHDDNTKQIGHTLFTLWLITVSLTLLYTLLAYLIAPYVVTKFPEKANILYFFPALLVAIPFIATSHLIAGAFRGLRIILNFQFLKNVALPIFAICFISLSMFLYENLNVSYPYIAAAISASVCSYYLWTKTAQKLGLPKWVTSIKTQSLSSVSHLAATGLPIMTAASLVFINTWATTIVVGLQSTTTSVALYFAAKKFASLTGMVTTSLESILAPKVAAAYAKNEPQQIQRFLVKSARFALALSCPVILILLFFPNEILGLYGVEFKEAAIALQILVIAQIFVISRGSIIISMNMTGYEKVVRNIVITSLLLKIFLAYFLIPAYGISGAALGELAAVIYASCFFIVFFRKKTGVSSHIFVRSVASDSAVP